ncbi:MAG: hypothetical protein HY847_09520 [Betaproteobacteria bacterium]|nr:hypothetical protein [Betaproteobacteria bacterium]
MKTVVRIQLAASPEQTASLADLQRVFADLCNVLSPIVRETHCWNRVGLHHLAYRVLRERFPQIGSQMICNAIYSVSRTSRIVYQKLDSPWNVGRRSNEPLPLIKYLANSPVYFDRHTLSLKNGRLSMYTLEGRLRFDINLSAEDEQRFHQEKLYEIVLTRKAKGFQLAFFFSQTEDVVAESEHIPAYFKVLGGSRRAMASSVALLPAKG